MPSFISPTHGLGRASPEKAAHILAQDQELLLAFQGWASFALLAGLWSTDRTARKGVASAARNTKAHLYNSDAVLANIIGLSHVAQANEDDINNVAYGTKPLSQTPMAIEILHRLEKPENFSGLRDFLKLLKTTTTVGAGYAGFSVGLTHHDVLLQGVLPFTTAIVAGLIKFTADARKGNENPEFLITALITFLSSLGLQEWLQDPLFASFFGAVAFPTSLGYLANKVAAKPESSKKALVKKPEEKPVASPPSEEKSETTDKKTNEAKAALAAIGVVTLALIGATFSKEVLQPLAVEFAQRRDQTSPFIPALITAGVFAGPALLAADRIAAKIFDVAADPEDQQAKATARVRRFRKDMDDIAAADITWKNEIADLRTVLPERATQHYLRTQNGITPSVFVGLFSSFNSLRYLSRLDSDKIQNSLAATGIITPSIIDDLNKRHTIVDLMYATAIVEMSQLAQREPQAQMANLLPAPDGFNQYLTIRGQARMDFLGLAASQGFPWEAVVSAFPMLPQLSFRHFFTPDNIDLTRRLSEAGQTSKLLHLSLFPISSNNPNAYETPPVFNPRRELATLPLIVQAMETLALFSHPVESTSLISQITQALKQAKLTTSPTTFQALLKDTIACIEFSQDIAGLLLINPNYNKVAKNSLNTATKNLDALRNNLLDKCWQT